MTEPMNPQRERDDQRPEEGEIVANLLRLAGPRADASQEAKERVKAIVRARWRESVAGRRRRRVLAWLSGSLATAAVILLTVMVETRQGGVESTARGEPAGTLILNVGVVRGSDGATVLPGSAIPFGAALETTGDARAAVRLIDGATVRLDAETRIMLEARSELKLERGTIYVESGVVTKESRGLEIHTGIGVVRDVGTRFEVRVRDHELRVRVRQGAVSLDREGRSHEILSGSELVVDDAGGAKMGAVPANSPVWNWILDAAPEFELEGRNLGEFLDWVSSETGLSVRFADRSIEREARGIVLHGSVRGFRPDQAPDVVLPTCGLNHRVVGDTLIVGREISGDTF